MNEYEEKLKSVVKGKVVVYIDAANLEQSVKDMFVRPDDVPDNFKHLSADVLRWSIDYKKLNDFFKTVGVLSEQKMCLSAGIFFYSFNRKKQRQSHDQSEVATSKIIILI